MSTLELVACAPAAAVRARLTLTGTFGTTLMFAGENLQLTPAGAVHASCAALSEGNDPVKFSCRPMGPEVCPGKSVMAAGEGALKVKSTTCSFSADVCVMELASCPTACKVTR